LNAPFSSSSRRLALLGVLVLAGAIAYSVIERRDTSQRLFTGGDFGVCAKRHGDEARACYKREASRELAAVGGAAPQAVTFVTAPASSGEVTFASSEAELPTGDASLLCALHERVGAVDAGKPAWLGWSEPLAQTAAAR
jgi:hypothetical protein